MKSLVSLNSGGLAITDVRLVVPDGIEPGALLVDGGRIVALRTGAEAVPPDGYATVEGRGRYCAPGLIDVHVHGGGGFDLMTDDPEQIRGYARWIVERGVTSFLVSTAGRNHAEIVARLRSLAPLCERKGGPTAMRRTKEPGARIAGFHLEGPYINPVRKGAFPPRWLRAPSVDEYRELFEAAGGAIRQMTIAPELAGGDALVDAVAASGAVAAIGHTDATYGEAMGAISRGVTHATHCYNAMRPFGHRDPGVLGAVMTSDGVTAELIGDGAHVDFAAARVLIRAKGARNVVLITDGMPLAGTPDGGGEWEGQAIRVEGGKAVRDSDNMIIGGVITLDQCVRNAVVHMEAPPHAAIAMASANPAHAMRLHDRGVLAPGRLADFILLDEGLRVTETWVAGERVFVK